MVFVCIVLVVILVFVLVRHLHFVWQIKSINEQIEFINTHETNKIVTGEYRNGSITDLINNINALSRQCSILKTQCLTNESNMKETITNISHDIRTPLTSLSGYFQLMCQCNSSAEREKYSKIISQQISILQEMLEELFTYAKLSSQSYEITSEKYHCEKLFQLRCSFLSKKYIQTFHHAQLHFLIHFEKPVLTPYHLPKYRLAFLELRYLA